jgi:hypothetical protein
MWEVIVIAVLLALALCGIGLQIWGLVRRVAGK